MTIDDIVIQRKISEILHFTTNEGLLGILYSGALKSRQCLPQEKQLEYIYKPNAVFTPENWQQISFRVFTCQQEKTMMIFAASVPVFLILK